jgi:hypothetical protein
MRRDPHKVDAVQLDFRSLVATSLAVNLLKRRKPRTRGFALRPEGGFALLAETHPPPSVYFAELRYMGNFLAALWSLHLNKLLKHMASSW